MSRSPSSAVLASLVALVLLATAARAAARPYAWLGVRIRDLSEAEMDEISARHGIREGFGVFIVDVLEGTPAARAGLGMGDVIVAIDGRPVVDSQTLQRLVASAPLDTDVRVTVLRTDGRHDITLRLAPMPRPILGDRNAAQFGFVIRGQDEVDARATALSAGAPTIAGVRHDSPAERAGLETGDVVLAVNDTPVMTRDKAREAFADVSPDQPLRLTVRRGGSQMSLTLPATSKSRRRSSR